MNEKLSGTQQIQELEYNFPYHYISEFRGGFNQTYNWTWGIYHISAIEFLLEYLRKLEFESIADIGCGDGRFVRELAIEFKNRKIVGVDYSPKAIQLAKAMNPSLEFYAKDIIKESLDTTFDVVTLIEVLEHIPPDSVTGFIQSLHRLVNQRGSLVLTVPHVNKPLEDKHFQHFTPDLIKSLFADTFRVVETIPFERMSMLAKVMNKMLSNPLFIVNNQAAKNLVYKFYKKRLFYAALNNCARFFVRLEKI